MAAFVVAFGVFVLGSLILDSSRTLTLIVGYLFWGLVGIAFAASMGFILASLASLL